MRITIDDDTAVALAYLRGCESAERVSAGLLLRVAAQAALAEQGRQAVHGVIVPIKAQCSGEDFA